MRISISSMRKAKKILIDAVVNAKGPTQGGSIECVELHNKAKEKYRQQLMDSKNEKGASVKRPKKQISMKSLKMDKNFRNVVKDVMEEENFSDPGLEKPSVFNMFLIKGFARSSIGMQIQIALAKELSVEQKEYLIQKALGNDIYESLSEEELKDASESEAWKKENVEAWIEDHGFGESDVSKKKR